MVISDRTKGCCSSDLNEPPHPNHDQFAELDAHNSAGLVLRWVSGRGRPGRRLHEIGAWPAIFRSSSITNCGSAGCSRSASTGPLLSSGGRQVFVPTGG